MALNSLPEPKRRLSVKARRAWKTQSLDAVIEHAITPMCKQFGFAEYRLLTEWEQIVGASFAARTAPVRIRFFDKAEGRRPEGGVLTIHAFDSSVALECSYMEPMILERIAVYFGFSAVKKIQIVQYPRMEGTRAATRFAGENDERSVEVKRVARTKAEAVVASVEDGEMRAALSSLAEAFYRKSAR